MIGLTEKLRKILRKPLIRTRELAKHYAKQEAAGECTFCTLSPKDVVVHDGQYWHVIHNRWPYKHTRLHLLIIPKRHINGIGEMAREEHAELYDIEQWLLNKYGLTYAGEGSRHGDDNVLAGATKRHYHIHWIVGNHTDEVMFRLAIRIPKRMRKKVLRLIQLPEDATRL